MEGEIISAAQNFEFDEDSALPLDKFFFFYRDKFPMLAVIVDGHYGETVYDCFENFQVFRIHCYSSQPRVVCTDRHSSRGTAEKYYTLPLKNNYGFQKITSHTSEGEVQSLEEILAESDLPVLVKFACKPSHAVRMTSWERSAGDIGNLLVKATYEEHYMMVNCVDTKELKMNSTSCLMGLSKQLTATPIEGFKYKTMDEFRAFLKQLDGQVATSGEVYVKTKGNPTVVEYEHDQPLPSEVYRALKYCCSSEATGDDDESSGGEYEEVTALPPRPPDRQKAPTSPTGRSDERSGKAGHHKRGILGNIASKFGKQKPAEKDNHKDSGESKATEKESKTHVYRKQSEEKGPPPIPKKSSAEELKTGTSDNPPPLPSKPTGGNERGDPVDDPPAVPKRPIPKKKKEKEETVCGKKPGPRYENHLPSAVVRPIKGSPIPSSMRDRKPQPLPENSPEDETERGVYSEVFGEDGLHDMPSDIYHPGDEAPANPSGEYIQVASGKKSLRIKCIRRSQEMSMKPKNHDTRPPGDRKTKPDGKDRENIQDSSKDLETGSDTFDITSMSIGEVCKALKTLRLEKYVADFEENQIDGEILSQLSVDDMVTELSMKKLEAVRLERYAQTGHIPK